MSWTILVALAVLIVDVATLAPQPSSAPADSAGLSAADYAVEAAMTNDLMAYSLQKSGFTPALSTSTPSCSGPLALNASADGRVAVFGRSCSAPETIMCRELDMTSSGPRPSATVTMPAGDFSADRFSCQ